MAGSAPAIPALKVWRIIGRDADDDKESDKEERARFLDLHYDRFTYYPFHDRARMRRDFLQRHT